MLSPCLVQMQQFRQHAQCEKSSKISFSPLLLQASLSQIQLVISDLKWFFSNGPQNNISESRISRCLYTCKFLRFNSLLPMKASPKTSLFVRQSFKGLPVSILMVEHPKPLKQLAPVPAQKMKLVGEVFNAKSQDCRLVRHLSARTSSCQVV